MTARLRANLQRLLAPRHAAFIGGTDAAIAAEHCRALGFDGPVWGVNPRRQDLAGHPCFARVEDLPEAPDAVFLAVPRDAAIEVVEALRRRGAGGVVCYTAGYGELGEEGAELERALVSAAGDMALVGPNCYGLINYVRGVALWPFAFGSKRVERGVAVITQSGMLGSDITMNRRSAPLAYVVSAGNQAMLGVEDYLEVLVGDPAVAAVGLHLEGLRDATRFCQAAIGALEAGVPIVALKTGTSDIGRRLTTTHTGSLAGEDEVYQALFDRLGIIRVDSPVQLLETLKVLSLTGVPHGRRLTGFAASGGNVTLLADYAERLGLSFPPPSPSTAEIMTSLLPAVASVSNPLDYTTPLWGREAELTALFEAVLTDAYDAALLVQDYPHPGLDAAKEEYRADARAFMTATRKAGLPAAVVSALPENIDKENRETMIAGGIAPLQGIKEAMVAVAGAAAYGERRAGLTAGGRAAGLALPRPACPRDRNGTSRCRRSRLSGSGETGEPEPGSQVRGRRR
jgi:acyl-CoA synthetase (NDP forming)